MLGWHPMLTPIGVICFVLYIHISVRSSVARSGKMGNLRASRCRTGNTYSPHVFFCILVQH